MPRRLFPTKNSQGITLLSMTAIIFPKPALRQALEFLKETFPKRRKIIIAAGLVEQGVSKNENNKWFGEKIKTIGDLNLIIRNSNTQFIIKGTNLPEKEILEYNKNRRFETINQKIVIFENAEELNFSFRNFKIRRCNFNVSFDLPAHYY